MQISLTPELERLAEKIAAGVTSLRAGESVDGEAVFDRLESELDAVERQ